MRFLMRGGETLTRGHLNKNMKNTRICQAELRKLTDRVREERTRALCSASLVDDSSSSYTLVPITSYIYHALDHIKDFPYSSSSMVTDSMVKKIMTC